MRVLVPPSQMLGPVDPGSGDQAYNPEEYDAYYDRGVVPGAIDEGIEGGASSGNPTDYKTKTCKLVINYHISTYDISQGAPNSPPSKSVVTYSGKKKKITLKTPVKYIGTAVSNPYYSSKGKRHVGWSTTNATSSAASSFKYDTGDIFSHTWQKNESGTITLDLYAVWTADRVVYSPGDYADEKDDKYPNKHSVINASTGEVKLKDAIFHRTGYTQTGWVNKNNNDDTYSLNTTYILGTGGVNLTLIPTWTGNSHDITYHNNVSSNSQTFSDNDVSYGDEYTIKGPNFYSKQNYHIAYWNEKADGSGSSWFPGKTYEFTRDEDIDLYAIWEGNKNYVVYSDDETQTEQITFGGILYNSDYGIDSMTATQGYVVIDPVTGATTYVSQSDFSGILYSAGENNNFQIIDVGDDSSLLFLYGTSFGLDTETLSRTTRVEYGLPFYTDYRPPNKENYTFDGWITGDGIRLVKQDAGMDVYSIPFDQNNPSDPTWTGTENIILYPVWSGKYPFGKVFFGRDDTTKYGIIIEEPPDYYWPEKQYSHAGIKGKNGSIILDPRNYENVSKKYKMLAYDKNGFSSSANGLSTFLHRYNGYEDYMRLQDTYEPDVYMLAIYEEANSAENILGQAARSEITFNCKPQKFLTYGNREIEIPCSKYALRNQTMYPALPIIKVRGYGWIHFFGWPSAQYETTVAGNRKRTEMVIYENFNEIVFDSETFSAVNTNGYNMNPYMYVDGQIMLYPGKNTITFEDTIEKITIIPRWWRL